MNIGQFRRHLETLPDDALVVFESENTDTSLAFPAMSAERKHTARWLRYHWFKP